MNICDGTIDARLTRLAFPLNVFACATVFQEGQVKYLHYGLFSSPHESIQTAQQRSTDLILRRLPTHIDRCVLEIGVGLGVTAKTLADRGYRVTGISPDPVQVSIAHEHAGAAVSLHVSRLEELGPPPHAVDVILAQESSQYVDLAVLFTKARDLLTPGGSVLIVDQVALRRVSPDQSALHLDADIKAQAHRFGFTLIEHMDLTRQAMPTLDYILGAIGTHRQRLQELMQMEASKLDGLVAGVAANRGRYHEGILGYALYHFRRYMEQCVS